LEQPRRGRRGDGSGKAYNKKECFQQALKLKVDFPEAWYALGVLGGGTVFGKPYSEKECYLQALELKEDLPDAWGSLGARCRCLVLRLPGDNHSGVARLFS
jgi:hypothetical protein